MREGGSKGGREGGREGQTETGMEGGRSYTVPTKTSLPPGTLLECD